MIKTNYDQLIRQSLHYRELLTNDIIREHIANGKTDKYKALCELSQIAEDNEELIWRERRKFLSMLV